MNRFALALALSFSGLVSAESFYPSAVEVLLPSGQKNHSYRIELLVAGDAYGVQSAGMRKTGDGFETVLGPTNDRRAFHGPKAMVLAEARGGMLKSLGAQLDVKNLTSVGLAMVGEQLHAFRDPRLSDLEIRVVTVKTAATMFYHEVSTSNVIARYSLDKREWVAVTGADKTSPAFALRFID